MQNLTFNISINAPIRRVWDVMIAQESYRVWTSDFCEGSYYEGSWEDGERIRFLAPDGGGMTSVIAENRLHEFISVKHLGYIVNGVDDTESDEVRSWAPAFENYTFRSEGDVTLLQIDSEVTPEFEAYMNETWPKALQTLKVLCEAGDA